METDEKDNKIEYEQRRELEAKENQERQKYEQRNAVEVQQNQDGRDADLLKDNTEGNQENAALNNRNAFDVIPDRASYDERNATEANENQKSRESHSSSETSEKGDKGLNFQDHGIKGDEHAHSFDPTSEKYLSDRAETSIDFSDKYGRNIESHFNGEKGEELTKDFAAFRGDEILENSEKKLSEHGIDLCTIQSNEDGEKVLNVIETKCLNAESNADLNKSNEWMSNEKRMNEELDKYRSSLTADQKERFDEARTNEIRKEAIIIGDGHVALPENSNITVTRLRPFNW